MIALGSAAVFLLASHSGIASSRLRDVLVRRLGGRGYLGSYSLTLVAFAGWSPPTAARRSTSSGSRPTP
jgi:hypothetical protein